MALGMSCGRAEPALGLRGPSWIALLITLALGGCGDDTPPGAPTDGSVDTGDGSILPDGALPADTGLGGPCVLRQNLTVDLGIDSRGTVAPVSLTSEGEHFVVAFTDGDARMARISPDTDVPSFVDISAGPSDAQAPSVLQGGSLVAWADNAVDGFEIYARSRGAGGALGPTQRITTNAMADSAPILTRTATGVLVAWIQGGGSTPLVKARPLDAFGAPTATALDTLSDAPILAGLTLGRLGSGPALLWVEPTTLSKDVKLLRLSDAGAAMGEAVVLNQSANASSVVNLATNGSHAAVVFDVLVGGARRSVRFRALGEDGSPLAGERELLVGPQQGLQPSITALADGYVVSYRALLTDTEAEVALLLIDTSGNVVGRFGLSEASTEGGRTAVAVSSGGEIAVAWSDRMDGMTTYKLTRVGCEI